jgi:5-methylcytosine-specific restriction endonuclease McrA
MTFDQDEYEEYLQSAEWAEIRDRVLERDDYICQGCLKEEATQVHHKTYDHVFEEFAFELIALCETCHARFHGRPLPPPPYVKLYPDIEIETDKAIAIKRAGELVWLPLSHIEIKRGPVTSVTIPRWLGDKKRIRA